MQYHLPAEWCPQSGVMLAWPHADSDWQPFLEEVEDLYTEIALGIAAHESLLLVCHDAPVRTRAESRLLQAGIDPKRMITVIVPCNDTWTRDYGPLTTVSDGLASIKDFIFNGWGGRYIAHRDDRVSASLNAQEVFRQAHFETIPVVLEGGAIETDGQGTLLATRRALRHDRRNPGLGQAQLEALLNRHLGFDRFLWLEHGGISGDDTDGHIDTLARFCDAQTITYTTAHPDDPDHPELDAMFRELAAMKTREGKPYRLLPLPPIEPLFDSAGSRLPANYTNFLVINGAVLAPVYATASDPAALMSLQACFPGRQIIPFDCRPLIRQNGSLHCISMQFPVELSLHAPRSREKTDNAEE